MLIHHTSPQLGQGCGEISACWPQSQPVATSPANLIKVTIACPTGPLSSQKCALPTKRSKQQNQAVTQRAVAKLAGGRRNILCLFCALRKSPMEAPRVLAAFCGTAGQRCYLQSYGSQDEGGQLAKFAFEHLGRLLLRDFQLSGRLTGSLMDC